MTFVQRSFGGNRSLNSQSRQPCTWKRDVLHCVIALVLHVFTRFVVCGLILVPTEAVTNQLFHNAACTLC